MTLAFRLALLLFVLYAAETAVTSQTAGGAPEQQNSEGGNPYPPKP